MASGANRSAIYDVTEAYVLYGAVIAGPDKLDGYYDLRGDWPQTEVVSPLGVICRLRLIQDIP